MYFCFLFSVMHKLYNLTLAREIIGLFCFQDV
nr:MAG TPA: hypothetical protein [Caudoviricetes sp.]